MGECGVHHKGKRCSDTTLIRKVRDTLTASEKWLFPKELLQQTPAKRTFKMPKVNGGWGDRRDHQLCMHHLINSSTITSNTISINNINDYNYNISSHVNYLQHVKPKRDVKQDLFGNYLQRVKTRHEPPSTSSSNTNKLSLAQRINMLPRLSDS